MPRAFNAVDTSFASALEYTRTAMSLARSGRVRIVALSRTGVDSGTSKSRATPTARAPSSLPSSHQTPSGQTQAPTAVTATGATLQGLVDPTGNGAKVDSDIGVRSHHGAIDRKWKPVIGAVGRDLFDRSMRRCSRVVSDAPLCRIALSGAGEAAMPGSMQAPRRGSAGGRFLAWSTPFSHHHGFDKMPDSQKPFGPLPSHGRFAYRPITDPRPHLDIGIAYHADAIAPAARTFLQAAQQAGRAMR